MRVYTTGVFDILHRGHLDVLTQAAALEEFHFEARRPTRRVRAELPSRILLGLWLLLHAAAAAAYIDPGTRSALFYVVSGIVVSLYFAIRGLYYRLIEAVLRVRHKDQRCDLAIHCEEPRYEITFLPVLRALVERGLEPTFFTMYERDASFEPLPEKVTHRAIAPGMVGYAYLNHIEADLLVIPQVAVFLRDHVVAAQHGPRELLGREVHLVRARRRPDRPGRVARHGQPDRRARRR